MSLNWYEIPTLSQRLYWYEVPFLSNRRSYSSLYLSIFHTGQFERLGYGVIIGQIGVGGDIVYTSGCNVNIIFSFPCNHDTDVFVAHSVSVANSFLMHEENISISVTHECVVINSLSRLICFDCIRMKPEEEEVDWVNNGF